MGETQRADPFARRAAVAIVGCGTLIGVVLIAVTRRFGPELEGWLERDVRGRLTLVAWAMTILTTGPLLGLAVYLWRLGRRTLSADRYPPLGLRLMRDTPVVTGPAADRRGRLLEWLAVVLGRHRVRHHQTSRARSR